MSGLSLTDRIAFPDESVKAGMTAVDAGYASEEPAGMENGAEGMDGMDGIGGMDGMDGEPVGENGMTEPALDAQMTNEDEAQDGAEG